MHWILVQVVEWILKRHARLQRRKCCEVRVDRADIQRKEFSELSIRRVVCKRLVPSCLLPGECRNNLPALRQHGAVVVSWLARYEAGRTNSSVQPVARAYRPGDRNYRCELIEILTPVGQSLPRCRSTCSSGFDCCDINRGGRTATGQDHDIVERYSTLIIDDNYTVIARGCRRQPQVFFPKGAKWGDTVAATCGDISCGTRGPRRYNTGERIATKNTATRSTTESTDRLVVIIDVFETSTAV